MGAIRNLDDLFFETVRRCYDAERQLFSELPEWIEIATAFELEQLLADEVKRTLVRSQRLEETGEELGISVSDGGSGAMRGLIQEMHRTLDVTQPGDVRDAALSSLYLRIVHYQIAVFRSIRDFARQLGYMYIFDLTNMSLEELEKTNKAVRHLAENKAASFGL